MNYWPKKVWIWLSLLLIVLIFGIGGGVYGFSGSQPVKAEVVTPGNKASEIPVVGTLEKLQELLNQSYSLQIGLYGQRSNVVMDMSGASTEQAAAPSAAEVKTGYSQTNIQVEGVDEADIVKTDGDYIYVLSNSKLSVVKAMPADKMRLVSTVDFNSNDFHPRDLYVDTKHLVVTGDSYRKSSPVLNQKKSIYPVPPGNDIQTSKVIIYDIKDKDNITKSREIEVEGYCLSTRKIGSSLYLVTNRNTNYYRPGDPIILPSYRDSSAGNDFQTISCDNINYFPNCIYQSFLIVAAIDTDNLNQKVDIKTYLGNGDNIYASSSNLYIAINSYSQVQPLMEDSAFPTSPSGSETEIYRFALKGASTTCTGRGKVPGTILNQFSMDEYQGFFRIATTSGEIWSRSDNVSHNHIYVLDGNLKLAGKLENIAPGEKIYSTRFMGDRAYMVTFRNVDPFFVIDLKEPQKPKILGKLKIPGYSDYLHPYDENHIIGFGKDTVEAKGWGGEPQAYYQGLKIAIFDVTDVSNPVEMSRAVIGDRGTDSEILNNHKALLFSKDKNLLAFPVTLMELIPDNESYGNIPAYGSFTFQGAYIYNIDLKKGLEYKGRISHLDAADYQRAGDYWYDSDNNIKRVLYIGDALYTVSPTQIRVNSIADLHELYRLNL